MTDSTGSAAAGNPGADASGTQTGAAGTGAPAANAPWYGEIADPDLKGFVELKGWKTPADALQSYRNLEKLQGVPADRLLKLPETGDAAGLAEIHKRLGVAPPEKPADYGLSGIEGLDPGFVTAAEGIFHKHGLPKDMAAGAMKEVAGVLAQMEKDFEEARVNTHNADIETLKREWGGNHDRNIELARRAAAEYMPRTGLTDADMDIVRDALGSAKFNKLWAGIGSTMGEAAFHTGEGVQNFNGAMTPEAAKVRRDQLLADKSWVQRYSSGDIRARNEWAAVGSVLAAAAAATGTIR